MSSPAKTFYVNILSSRSRTLYIGVTNDLARRVHEHKTKETDGFTSRYNIDRLVYFEAFGSAQEAIVREKQIKAWARAKKVAIIQAFNPAWDDLSETWNAATNSLLWAGT